MRKILTYLKSYKKECVLAPLFKLLEATFELFVPLVVAAIVDTGIARGDTGYILRMCGIMILLGVIGLACSVTAQYFAARAAVGFSTKLRHELFAHIQGLSFTELDQAGTSTMITRMTNDVNQVQSGVNLVLRLFMRSPFIVFGAMAMAFTIDVKAAMVFVVTIPLLSVVVFGVMLISIPLYRRVQNALDQVLGKTRENLTGARVIRAFHREEEEIDEFERRNGVLNSLQRFVGKLSGLMNPLTFIIINMAIVVLIYVGGVQVDTGVITQGEVVALVNYMSQILVELVKLANLIITVTKAVACGNRIGQMLEVQSSQKDGKEAFTESGTPEDYIVFEHAQLTYAGSSVPALADLNLRVKQGQTIGVIGGTGSGKTSFVHLLPRFYDTTAGSVRIGGRDVKDYRIEELRRRIGIVMQKAVLFHGTIRENLLWGNENATEEELWAALDTAQARNVVESKTLGLDEPVGQGGGNFSGGQRQRLTIARALVRRPDILILDDSASALDYATDAALRKAIRGMSGGMTVFIVSQRTSSIQHADQIVVLDDGRMVGLGTHDELLEGCEIYREIYESQYRKEGA
ncbi:MAG: ABC transporter ATP-binding protein [Lachnospiraceae bacterium]|nr:ABC transporter ATP-binding protein [Lachnospiraceae bacterium]